MDVLALYDIHGNRDALDAVLADPAAAGADALVVGGDAVPGPFAAAVLDRLDALTVPVHGVRGNGEREVADPPPGDDLVAQTARRSAEELGRRGPGRSARCPSHSSWTASSSATPARAATTRCSRGSRPTSASPTRWPGWPRRSSSPATRISSTTGPWAASAT